MRRSGWRFPPERREVLRAPDRTERMPAGPMLEAAGLGSGQTVIDLGAGNGYWTEALSKAVGPEGRVIAVDVEPVMLDDLRSLITERGLTNVDVVQSHELSVPLDDDIADVVLLAFVLHEPPDLAAFLAEVVRLLRPDGRVLVIEWHDRPTETGPPIEVRVSAEEAQALLGSVGLVGESVPSPDPDTYAILARPFRAGDEEMTTPTV